ncbi:MAG: hypothetical protein NBV61_02635 [Algoriphagus sp.]|nr:hypothetical protein [Algoriphagus sp.]
MHTEKRFCRSCGQILHGRSDKKFCDDGCRNTFNNQQNSIQNKEIRNINSVLKRNRAILLAKLPEGKKQLKVSKDQLLVMGFNLRYMTHQLVLPSGLTAQFCYELGWVSLDEDCYLIVRDL